MTGNLGLEFLFVLCPCIQAGGDAAKKNQAGQSLGYLSSPKALQDSPNPHVHNQEGLWEKHFASYAKMNHLKTLHFF